VFWRQALDRADWWSVVAEFGGVVVFDDQGVSLRGPVHQRPPPLGAEDGAERELVRRGHDHRLGIAVGQVRNDQARLVDRDRQDLHPVRTCHRDLLGNRGILYCDMSDAAERHSAEQEVEAVKKAEGEDQVAGVGADAANS
jgi:hypothetical protein